ncbi:MULTISPECIES: hypothetical protein [unclassified Clostridioides]|uniref:hypothetical protein n=1 Tax=unclassified Clostridioides TaxID=2635829 RepID=UPI001D11A197|nr:hypothetical protein [Clostridioides sp. ZZV14-6150]MCC0661199.1 hypothetical protein [Clostridioides sp. ZZV14-6154]MCC0669021.1 hypothetical protein [Clostridioides sp. ZZV14-6153]MCC0720290.1 hypothetical protein [Clostridioides sp. ZZV14-6105]MCC0723163.1 hypothetical protein [Clostridioides sp. ZZV14-6104]MCC0728256.1 hypothetical protein [Clostridioides sp. ZZV14-6045]MCC0730946.1 hypothetical protein [Clostridioides sp. ZZV14-6048]MCC0735520.1 hypothetical protein [Clostridioides s
MNKDKLNNSFPKAPESFHNRLNKTLNSLPEREENYNMINNKTHKSPFKLSFKKSLIATLAVTLLLSTTALAVGEISSLFSSTSNKATYTSVPTTEQVKKDFKFAPNIVSEFSNGYKFKGGYIEKEKGLDKQGNILGELKSLNIKYENGNDEISLKTSNNILGKDSENIKVVDTYKDVNISYDEFKQKYVPEGYKMTEQDKLDEKSGKYTFSEWSGEVEVNEYKYLSWKQNGVYYSFIVEDSGLSMNDLVEMAHEVIDTK